MRCVICRQAFDFAAGQTAVVLHHVAYGYDCPSTDELPRLTEVAA